VPSLNVLSASADKKSPWHINLDYYWSLAGFLILPAVYTEVRAYNFFSQQNNFIGAAYDRVGSLNLWTEWALVKLAGMIVLYIFLHAVQLVFRISRIGLLKTRHIIEIGFFGGLLVGLTQLYLVKTLGIYDTATIFGRIFSPIPTYIFFLFVLSTLHTSVTNYKYESTKAKSALKSLNKFRISQQSMISSYTKRSNELRYYVKSSADTALSKVAEIDRSKVMDNIDIGKEIRLISDSTIRDLSHRMAENYETTKMLDSSSLFASREFDITNLLRDSAKFAPLDPFRFALASILLTSGAMIRQATLFDSFLLLGVGFTLVYATQFAGQLLFKKFRIHNIYTIVFFTFASGFLPYRIISSTSFIRDRIHNWAWHPAPLPMSFVLITVTIFGYLLQGGSLKSDEIVRRRNSDIADLRLSENVINTELVQISRNWARHLHGQVQSQILAATLMLESAQKDGDFAAVQEAFDLIMRVLENASEFNYTEFESLGDGVNKQISLWSEMIKIDLTLPSEIAMRTGPQIRSAVEVVGEMITNASRHGGATNIKIEIAHQKPNELQIRAVDNGTHFVQKSKGFGTRFFDEVSGGRWDIARNAVFGETTVSVLIDLPDSQEIEPTDVPFETAV